MDVKDATEKIHFVVGQDGGDAMGADAIASRADVVVLKQCIAALAEARAATDENKEAVMQPANSTIAKCVNQLPLKLDMKHAVSSDRPPND